MGKRGIGRDFNGLNVLGSSTGLNNNRTYIGYFYRLLDMSVNLIEWKNLPPEIDARFLELSLISQGMALFFRDEDLGEYLALTVRIGPRLTPYRIPIERTAYDVNGAQWPRTNKNSILIFNNYLRQPTIPVIMDYAQRLYEIQRAIDINVSGQKTPYILKGPQKQQLTLKNLYKQIDENERVIYADNNLDLDNVKVILTPAPYVADKLQVLKAQLFNEFLTYCGIENPGFEKRERVQNGEIDVTLGAVDAARYGWLSARQRACDEINRMFGLTISVSYHAPTLERYAEEVSETEEAEQVE